MKYNVCQAELFYTENGLKMNLQRLTNYMNMHCVIRLDDCKTTRPGAL